MKIFYYTYPWFLDASLSLIRVLSGKADLHVVMEVAPKNRKGVLFDLSLVLLRAGIVSALPLLNFLLPKRIAEYWRGVKSFHLMAHDSPQSTNPKSLLRGWQFAAFVKELKPDLIYFEDVSLRLALGSLFLPQIPQIIGVHDPFPHSGEADWRTRLARRLMYRKARQFILHNEFQKNDFIEKFRVAPDAVKAIPLGVYDAYSDLTLGAAEREKNNVLFFGRISPYKGLEVFLEAARQASQHIHEAVFTIVGKPIPGYRMPPLPELANGGRFDLRLERIPALEVGAYFQRATCVVCPYLDATQSGVVLTAYAFNTPVIATRVGGLPEYVVHEETGLLVEPSDPAGLSAAIVRILGDVDLRHAMERRIADLQAGRLSWDRISAQYLSAFETACR